MVPVRRPLGKHLGNDRVVRTLGYAMWCAPLAVAVSLTWQMTMRDPVARPVAQHQSVVEAGRPEKPIMTQAVLRPRREASISAALEAPASREQLLAFAFMPTLDVTVAAPAPVAEKFAPPRELTTASTRAPQVRALLPEASRDGRAWRMQTLREVGVAEGLRLISGGAMLRLAGVEPLDHDAQCKRLDGVQEPCSIRAASRLEVLTRGRTVTCRIYEAAAGAAPVASCRADKIDLADDLVKNGLARRADA